MTAVELLFVREFELRAAARHYGKTIEPNSGYSTQNKELAKTQLRSAAIAYAMLAKEIDESWDAAHPTTTEEAK